MQYLYIYHKIEICLLSQINIKYNQPFDINMQSDTDTDRSFNIIRSKYQAM